MRLDRAWSTKNLLDQNKWVFQQKFRSNESNDHKSKTQRTNSMKLREIIERDSPKLFKLRQKLPNRESFFKSHVDRENQALIPIVVTKNMVWHAELKLAQLNMVIWVFKRYIECIWCYKKDLDLDYIINTHLHTHFYISQAHLYKWTNPPYIEVFTCLSLTLTNKWV